MAGTRSGEPPTSRLRRSDARNAGTPGRTSTRPQASSGDARRALGAEGEARAAAALERAGYCIAARNVRIAGVELDLVVRRPGLVAIVEVKTRRSPRQGPAVEALQPRQMARLLRAGAAWRRAHCPRVRTLRFDLIACELRPDGRWELRHLPGAFDAGDLTAH